MARPLRHPRPPRRPGIAALVGVAGLAGAVAGCGSTHHHHSSAATTTPATTTPATATTTGGATSTATGTPPTSRAVGATTIAPGTSAPARPTLAPSPTTATAPQPAVTVPPCATLTADTLLHLVSATNQADGTVALTANPASVHCGGPDDLQIVVDPSHTVIAALSQGATVTVFPVGGQDPTIGPKSIPEAELASYLPMDSDTRTFIVSGPSQSLTSVQELFHP